MQRVLESSEREEGAGTPERQKIALLKAHGCQNDVILVDGSPAASGLTPDQVASFVRAVCDRENAIFGADGVYFIDNSVTPVVATYVNADGTPAEYCGNGIRCVARFLLEGQTSPEVLVASGGTLFRASKLPPSDGGVQNVSVTSLEPVKVLSTSVEIAEVSERLHFAHISVPNPHLVAVVDEYSEQLLRDTAGEVAASGVFPGGINTSLALQATASDDDFFVHTFERGSGLTPSCASGAVAAATTLVTLGAAPSGKDLFIRNVGGPITVRIDKTDRGLIPTQSGNATFMTSTEVWRSEDGDWTFGEVEFREDEGQSSDSLWWGNADHLRQQHGITVPQEVLERMGPRSKVSAS